MSGWTQAICEADWIKPNATWEGDRLVSIDRPARLKNPEIEQCCWCGEPTIFGVYVRVDPSKVPFPGDKGEVK